MNRVGRGRRLLATPLVAALLVTGTWSETPAQEWRTVTMSRQLSGERDLQVRVRYGAGRFRVAPAEPGLLYRMELRYDEESFEPVADYRAGRLELGVEGTGRDVNIDRGDAGELDVRLARNVAMDLDLEFGAVRADLDLGGLMLEGLELTTGAAEARVEISEPNPISMDRAEFHVGAAQFEARGLGNLHARRILVKAGVGNVELDFTGDWQEDAHVEVEMALGALELRFPRGVGVRLEKDAFLTAVDADEMVKRDGDTWYSTNWETAERRITVEVDAAFGGIDVRWVR